jgi:DNA anti-recombination protein RmuC
MRFITFALLLSAPLLPGCLVTQPQPPLSVKGRVAQEAISRYRTELQSQFQAAAADVRAGRAKSANDLHQSLKQQLTKARQSALAPLDALLEQEIAQSTWNPERVAQLLDDLATGF